MTRFTPLESDILDALAWDLRDIAPDLSGQFAESLPGSRRNTGSGLSTELIVDRDRPPPLTSPTGRFGTIHAMVGDLPDPVAFQVELRQGRLLALHGDAYGQYTRALDFARVPYDQIFTVDDQGNSVAFDPDALMPPSPLLDLHRHADSLPPPDLDRPLVIHGALQRVQEPGPPDLMGILFGAPATGDNPTGADDTLPDPAARLPLLIGLWAVITVGALLAVVVLRLPIFFAVFLAIGAGQLLNRPKVLSALDRAVLHVRRYRPSPQRTP